MVIDLGVYMASKLGIAEKNIKKIVSDLSILLSNTYVLYTKTQKFHWNVVDERFSILHKLFEEQYRELAEAVDEIAERIRMLEHKTPATLHEFLKLTTIKESDLIPGGQQMIRTLLADHEQIIREIRPKIAEFNELKDEGSGDLLIERMRAHEKMAWILRSHL